MANFKLIYQILSLLDKYLDYDESDWGKLSAENFKVSEKRFVSIMIMLYEAGYIDGIGIIHLGGNELFGIKIDGSKFPRQNGRGIEPSIYI